MTKNNLAKFYRGHLRERLKELDAALAELDVERLRRLGHTLKGSGLTYGFPEITAAGARLETAAESGESPLLREAAEGLHSAIIEAVTEG